VNSCCTERKAINVNIREESCGNPDQTIRQSTLDLLRLSGAQVQALELIRKHEANLTRG
jgi:hypothetical protein